MPEPRLPIRFVTELIAPRPGSARPVVQLVLMREAHGAMDLMRNLRPPSRGFTGASLGDGHLGKRTFSLQRFECPVGCPDRDCRFSGKYSELLLHSLKLRDRAAELISLERVARPELQHGTERSGDHEGARERKVASHGFEIERTRRCPIDIETV